MFLVRGSVTALAAQVAGNRLVPRLTEQFRFRFGYNPSRSEVRSWDRSIPALLGQLADAGLGEVEVLIEYQLPLTSKRADVVLLGQHPRGGPSCVVVENKQWSRVELVDIEHRLVRSPAVPACRSGCIRRNRSAAMWSTCRTLTGTWVIIPARWPAASSCTTPPRLASRGCAHPDLADLAFFPAFAADELAGLRAFLTSRLAPASGAQVADDFLQSRIAPSKQLLRHVQQEIAANPQFTLLDEQQVAYQVVLRAVEHAKRADAKEAVMITGGPGSGKSVIAIACWASWPSGVTTSLTPPAAGRSPPRCSRSWDAGSGGSTKCSGTPTTSLTPSATAWMCSSSMRRTGSGHVHQPVHPERPSALASRKPMSWSRPPGCRCS